MADNIAEVSLKNQAQLLGNTSADGTGTQKLAIVDTSGHILTAPGMPTAGIQFKAAVGTSAAVLTASAPKDSVTILNPEGGALVYLGFTSGVTTSNGFPLKAEASLTLKISNTNLIYAISGSSSQSLHVIGS